MTKTDDLPTNTSGSGPVIASSTSATRKTDAPQSFLRAARSGNLQKILDLLQQGVDINTSNPNGLNALHLASKEGHVNVVKELVNRGANVNAATKKGNTSLHIASLAGQYEVAKLLVEHNAQVNVQSQNGFTPLYMAAQDNHIEVVKFLLANGASQSLATDDGFTPLAVALQQGHDRTVALLLENDTRGKARLPALHIAAKKDDVKAASLLLENAECNVDQQSTSGFTPLHIAANYGNVNMTALLIEKGANVNFQARNNITPLHVSAKWGNLPVVQRLVESGAQLECKTRDGLTPLHCAARSGHETVVEYLLTVGANFAAKTKNGLSPLHIAAQGDHVDCGRLLIHKGANVDDTTVDYLTPIHVAAHCDSVKICKLLLDRRCEANARALNGFTPLHIACKKNRVRIIELLLKYGAMIEATTESGLTPLHVASFMGHVNIVVLLLQHGANPNAPTMRCETSLHLAVRAGQVEVARLLLRNNALVDAKARENQTSLHIAARLGNTELVQMLLAQGANPDNVTKDNYTALHIAAKEGHVEVAQLLLEKGNATLDATTKNGFTSLHIAAKYGQLGVARLLLEHGAAVNSPGRNGLTPLHVATHYGNDDIAHLLLKYNASAHSVAKNGYTPLHIAASKSRPAIAKKLLEEATADSNAQSRNGFAPLHLAAQEGSTEVVRMLLQHGADVNARAKNGLCPLHLAAQEDHVNVAKILDAEYQCDISPKTKAGYTPLHTACHFGQINMARYLLGRGAPVNQQTQLGSTALHLAAQQGHLQLVYVLLDSGSDPNMRNTQDLTAAHVARRQHYLNIFEVLKGVTTVVETWIEVEEETVTRMELERPDLMGEHPVSDWDDEGAEPDYTTMPASPLFARQGTSLQSTGPDTFQYTLDHQQARESGAGEDGLQESAMLDHDIKQMMLQSEMTAAPYVRGYAEAPNAAMEWDVPADNVPITRKPITTGFLVSFLVDARGGSMRSSRFSGLRILVPPSAASAPTRITCRMQRSDRVQHPPQLNDGDGLACRILEMGPHGCKFNSPVLLEIPHYGSMRIREREVMILRSDNGETWKEHTLEATDQAVVDAMGGFFDTLENNEELRSRRIVRILTTDFPQYFALVTRLRQETTMIGVQGGVISSTVVPQVQAVFPENALQKKIRVGLQAQPINPELVLKVLGNRVAVSPIVTVEPRRRKFHKPITLTIPLPKMPTVAGNGGGDFSAGSAAANLRLLCSITGGTSAAHWEDITGSTPLSRVKDCISFTTTVSARFWLMDCQNVAKSGEMADALYRESIFVPYMAKFVVFGKRTESVDQAALRFFCITDDKVDKTLECQEGFELRAASPEVEVLQDCDCWIEFGSGGNLIPMLKQSEQLRLHCQAFRENRLPLLVHIKDTSREPVAKIIFMKESRSTLANELLSNTSLLKPLCTLEVSIPSHQHHSGDSKHVQYAHDLHQPPRSPLQEEDWSKLCVMSETVARSELDLSEVAAEVGSDWPKLAEELGLTKSSMHQIATSEEHVSEKDRAWAVLLLWHHENRHNATGNELDRVLRRIGREDVIKTCMRNIAPVTVPSEIAEAIMKMDEPRHEHQDHHDHHEHHEESEKSPVSIAPVEEVPRDPLPRVEDGEPMEAPDMQEVEFVRESESMQDDTSAEAAVSLHEHHHDESVEDEEVIMPVLDERRAPVKIAEAPKIGRSNEEKNAAYLDLIGHLEQLPGDQDEEELLHQLSSHHHHDHECHEVHEDEVQPVDRHTLPQEKSTE